MASGQESLLEKPKLYLETTIPSYLAARPSFQTLVFTHQHLTQQWWIQRRDAFRLFISELVLEECRAGDPQLAEKRLDLLRQIPVLGQTKAIVDMAESLVDGGPIPPKAIGDALHVATATIYGCEYLLTWNCRHIANAEIRRAAHRITAKHGYELPVICTPEELMGEQSATEL